MLQLILVISIGAVAFASPPPQTNDDSIFHRILQVANNADIKDNNLPSDTSNRSLEEHIEYYLKSHNFSFKFPFSDSTVTLDARNLDNSELAFKLDFSSENEVQARKKKSKLKKIFGPLLILVLLKAIVVLPLALGVLGIKTWNAVQLSFVSFVTSVALAVWKLCTKLSQDHAPGIIHNSWPSHAYDRSDTSQQTAYSGYAPF